MYTFSHFCVDFACFFMLFGELAARENNLQTLSLCFLIYNVIAFGLQPIFGFLCDCRRLPMGVIGCGTVLVGVLLLPFLKAVPVMPAYWVPLVICALGNAAFHVGGGIDSLVLAGGKMGRSGVFVSSGALGVTLGTLAGKSGPFLAVPAVLLAAAVLLLWFFCPGEGHVKAWKPETGKPVLSFRTTTAALPLAAVLGVCMLCIVVRSYVGSTVPMPWRTTAVMALLPGIGACLGKAAGGFLADVLGAQRTGVLTLLLSLPFLVWGNGVPVLCIVGLILFNCTMPVTLCAVASKLPDNPGLAFGLTTLGLLVGNVPTFFLAIGQYSIRTVLAALIVLSALCLFVVLNNTGAAMQREKAHLSEEEHAV